MRRFTIVETIDAPAERLFFLSESYEAWMRWDPFVRKLQFLNGATRIEKGVATRTIAYNGLAMDTEFIAYDPPYVIAMKMISGPRFFDTMAGSWRFRETAAGATEVTFIYSFRTRPGWLRFVMEPVVERVFRRDMQTRMMALARQQKNLHDVLVLGGYGTFGGRISRALAKAGLRVVVAGRSLAKASAFVNHIRETIPGSALSATALDLHRDLREQVVQRQPSVVIDTCGPFQSRDYTTARICIDAGVHYIDLADARDYVASIGKLDSAARAAGVLVVAGASSVPGLSSAVVEHFAPEFDRIDSMVYGISAAQRAGGGLATVQSVAAYVGRKLAPCPGHPVRYGWQGLYRQRYPGVGSRWMADCDVPDLDLLPQRYGIGAIRFSAGADNSLSHLGIWLAGWCIRKGLPVDLSKHGALLSVAYQAMRPFGSLTSAMHVILRGRGRQGEQRLRRWFIIARNGDGPHIPCVPAILLAKRLVQGAVARRGAVPCVGLISLDDYLTALGGFDIQTITDADGA